MKSLKGTETAINLMKSFAGESQARNRYTFYASAADKEGFKQIKNIFNETADNEKEHAKRFFKFLLAGFKDELPQNIEIQAGFPVAQGITLDNLKAAAHGENEEWSNGVKKIPRRPVISPGVMPRRMISCWERRV